MTLYWGYRKNKAYNQIFLPYNSLKIRNIPSMKQSTQENLHINT